MIINHMVLFNYRWAIPIMAEIYRNIGVKFIYLHKKLLINKGVLSKTLQVLRDASYIQKNPGYGHPLRPEYIINKHAKIIAGKCRKIYETLVDAKLQHLLTSKWNLPVIMVMQDKSLRFSELKKEIYAITSRSLTKILKFLENEKILERTITSEYPPTSHYHLRPRFSFLYLILLDFNKI